MKQTMITLFISEQRANTAAKGWLQANPHASYQPHIIPATMRDHDGTVDQGFKCAMRTTSGEHAFFL